MIVQRLLFLLVLVLTILLTGGCASLFIDPPAAQVIEPPKKIIPALPPEPRPASASQGILDYLYDIQGWAPERLNAHVAELEKAYAVQPDEALRMRLAIVLGFGRCAECKQSRAKNLFDEVLGTAQDGAALAMASLCIDLIDAKAKISATNRKLVKERKLANELQKKLEALTLIEESLHQRE